MPASGLSGTPGEHSVTHGTLAYIIWKGLWKRASAAVFINGISGRVRFT